MAATREAPPHLAAASTPFTPMTHKQSEKETPFQPLKIGDLSTPKQNRSSSNSLHSDPPVSEPEERNESGEYERSLMQLRDSLKESLNALDKLISLKKKPSTPMSSIGIQVSLDQNKPQTRPAPREDHHVHLNRQGILKDDMHERQEVKKPSDIGEVSNAQIKKSSQIGQISSGQGSKNGSDCDVVGLQEKLHVLSDFLTRMEQEVDRLQ